MEFYALQDGWIKINAQDFPMGRKLFKSDTLLIGVNQLLLRINHRTVLIDAGLGNKWTLIETGLIGFKQPRQLMPSLAALGVSAEDIDLVVLSHLHLDHAGGCTVRDDDGNLKSTFPNAVYTCQKEELVFAQDPDNQVSGDYKPDDFQPLIASGQLKPVNGAGQIASGVKLFPTSGHSPGHQVILAEEGATSVFYSGDLFSVKEHTNLLIYTTYDYEPRKLLDERRIWLSRMENSGWICCFCHNFRYPLGKYINGRVIPLTNAEN